MVQPELAGMLSRRSFDSSEVHTDKYPKSTQGENAIHLCNI